jgi:hypothetical protein
MLEDFRCGGLSLRKHRAKGIEPFKRASLQKGWPFLLFGGPLSPGNPISTMGMVMKGYHSEIGRDADLEENHGRGSTRVYIF